MIDELADRREEQRPAAAAGTRLDDPIGAHTVDEVLVNDQVGGCLVHPPSQPRGVTPSQAVPERVREVGRELVGYRRGSTGAAVGSRGRARLAEGGRGHATGTAPERALEHRPDVVDGLARAFERSATQLGVMVGV